jgi:hypothetical protein
VGRGRKREVTLEVDQGTGKITVKKDSNMDVILVDEEKKTIDVLNPRDQLILERTKSGAIKVKEAPEKTKMSVAVIGTPTPAPADGTQEGEANDGA